MSLPFGRLLFVILLSITHLSEALSQALESGYQPQAVVVQFSTNVLISEGLSKTGLEVFDQKAHKYKVHTMTRMFPFLDRLVPTEKTEANLSALRHTYYVYYDAVEPPDRVALDLMKEKDVIYAEPIHINQSHGSITHQGPDDPLYDQLSYLQHIRLPEAWDIVKSNDASTPVVVAIVDTGSDWRHEDLRANVWTNGDEIPSNGVDDDENGFIDDIHGVNFCNQNAPNNDPGSLNQNRDDGFHGTAVAGVASAVSDNGIGITGAAWNAQLMHVKVVCSAGQVFHYEGIAYAAMNGADIINTSWGATHLGPVPPPSYIAQTLDLATDLGALVVASAGNNPLNSSQYPHYPARYYRVLSVGATQKDSRELAGFSAYGKTVDVFAPGVSILTTFPENMYKTARGTSFSAPLVSGIAALIKTRFPDIPPDALRERIRLSSENIDQHNHQRFTQQLGRGFVNAFASLQPPTLPGIRLRKWSLNDINGNGQIDSGNQVEIHVQITNFLADSEQLTLELVPADPYPFLSFQSSQVMIGQLKSQQSADAIFRFSVNDHAPSYQTVTFYPRVRDGTHTDDIEELSFGINTYLPETISALQALYHSTAGHQWITNSNWNTGSPSNALDLMSWYGVSVGDFSVRGISLPYNNLNGTIPPELRQLQNLWSLILLGNSLVGEIPDELSELSHLSELDLGENSLSGRIPMSLSHLKKMTRLELHHNALVGSIPKELGQLKDLFTLKLSHNQLSGQIPEELGQLDLLYELNLAHNVLTGTLPRSLMQIQSLKILEFDGQNVCAPADDEFQSWLQRIPSVKGATCKGLVFEHEVEHQSLIQGVEITPLTLPEAIGGAPPMTYSLKPALPTGLIFDQEFRIIQGIPSITIKKTDYVYSATDSNLLSDSLSFTMEVVSPVSTEDDGIPQQFALHSNYPNPFADRTHLRMDLPWTAEVRVEVLDITGRVVFISSPKRMTAGWSNEVKINGDGLSAGIYLYRVTVQSPDGYSEYKGSFVRAG
ncbi:MAG: S8 family serine peptidase [Bacteroidetes bacterium]|nr:S8 family serine peptidase [Bacteroidota bacterium]